MSVLVLVETTTYISITDVYCCLNKSILISRQAEYVVTGGVLWGPETGRDSKAWHAQWMLVKLWPQRAGSSVFLVLAAGWLQASRTAVSTGSGLPNRSRRPLSESAGCVAARRVAVVVCTPDELSWGKSNSNWLTSMLEVSIFIHCC
jgi:hypothetical protein